MEADIGTREDPARLCRVDQDGDNGRTARDTFALGLPGLSAVGRLVDGVAGGVHDLRVVRIDGQYLRVQPVHQVAISAISERRE